MKTAVFTLAVLTGIVVGIYLVFPARDHVLITEATAWERDPAPRWDLVAPSAEAAAAFVHATLPDAPIPIGKILGIGRIEVLDRDAIVVTYELDGERMTYAIQPTRGMAPDEVERVDGALRVFGWRRGDFTLAAVGPDATRTRWLRLFR